MTALHRCYQEDFMQTANTHHAPAENGSFLARHGNQITIALWIIAFASHAFLIPQLIRDVFRSKP
jgi:hypothetical protein